MENIKVDVKKVKKLDGKPRYQWSAAVGPDGMLNTRQK